MESTLALSCNGSGADDSDSDGIYSLNVKNQTRAQLKHSIITRTTLSVID